MLYAATDSGVSVNSSFAETGWKHSGLQGKIVRAVYPHPFAPIGYGVTAGIALRSAISTSSALEPQLPGRFELLPNYPNPFNPATTIEFRIPNSEFVILKVYDVLGREVANLVDEEKPAGIYTVRFNATDLGTGTYFCRLQARPTEGRQEGNATAVQKLLLVR